MMHLCTYIFLLWKLRVRSVPVVCECISTRYMWFVFRALNIVVSGLCVFEMTNNVSFSGEVKMTKSYRVLGF